MKQIAIFKRFPGNAAKRNIFGKINKIDEAFGRELCASRNPRRHERNTNDVKKAKSNVLKSFLSLPYRRPILTIVACEYGSVLGSDINSDYNCRFASNFPTIFRETWCIAQSAPRRFGKFANTTAKIPLMPWIETGKNPTERDITF